MGLALQRLAKEDPSFRVHTDQESGQTIISGMGELHLEIIVDRMKREFKVEANVGKPQVAYRETIRGTVESEGKFVRQSGGRGQYGHVWLKLEPQRAGQGLRVRQRHRRRRRAARVHPGRGQGHSRGRADRRDRRLPDRRRQGDRCSTAPTTTSTRTRWRSRSRARWASRKAFARAKPVLLEPIMKVEVVTPEDYYGDIVGDLNRRRGQIIGMEDSPSGKVVTAEVPLAGDVPVLDRDALHEPGARELHDGVREVHGSAEQCRRRRHEESVVTNRFQIF